MISKLAAVAVGLQCWGGIAKADEPAGAKEAKAAIECMDAIPGWEWPVVVQDVSYGKSDYLAKMQKYFVEYRQEMTDNPFAQLGPQIFKGMAVSVGNDGNPHGAAMLKCFSEHILTPATKSDNGCNYALIGVESWSAKSTNSELQYLEGSTRIEIRLISAAAQPTEMLDGVVELRDALNREIGRIKLDEDIRILPGKNWVQAGSYMPSDLDRLTRLKPEYVKAKVCVRSVLYEDGTVERFDE